MTDRLPSVTIVAGTLTPAPGPVATFGHMLRMHDAGTCSFEGCERVHSSKGYCKAHYHQIAMGRPLGPLGRRALSAAERFWQKVDKGEEDRCWMWTGATSAAKGYGQMWYRGRSRHAHSVAYELANGPIGKGLVVDHKCRVRACVNPAHLQAVTVRKNNENRGSEGRGMSWSRGVWWNKSHGKWEACVSSGGERHHLGYFTDPRLANDAVLSKRLELHTNNLLDRTSA